MVQRLRAEDECFAFTGDKFHQALKEIERVRPVEYPYWMSPDAIAQQVNTQVTHIVKDVVRKAWRFKNVSRIMDRELTADNIGEFIQGVPKYVKNLVVSNCTSGDWKGVLTAIAGLKNITGLELSNCQLTDEDILPIMQMGQLEKLSVSNRSDIM